MRKLLVFVFLIAAIISFAYVVKSDDVQEWARANSKDTFTFIVFGDSRPVSPTNPIPKDILSRFAFEIGLIHPDFVIFTGDFVIGYGDNEEEYRAQVEEFLSIMNKYAPTVPFIFVPGNHEVSPGKDKMEIFKEYFGKKLYFDFYFGKAHFVSINTNWPEGMAEGKYGFFNINDGEHEKGMVDWFEDIVAQPAGVKIVFGHVPAFSALAPNFEYEHTKSFDSKENRDEFVKLLVKNGVDAYIAGHEHFTYITKNENTLFFILGGGGAPLYTPVTGGYQINTHVKPYDKVTSDERVDFGGEASGYHYSLHVPAGALGIFSYMIVTVDKDGASYRFAVPFSFNCEVLKNDGRTYEVLVTNRTPYDIKVSGIEVYMPKYDGYEIETYYTDWGRKKKPVEYEVLEKEDIGDMVYMRIAVNVPATYAVDVVIRGK